MQLHSPVDLTDNVNMAENLVLEFIHVFHMWIICEVWKPHV